MSREYYMERRRRELLIHDLHERMKWFHQLENNSKKNAPYFNNDSNQNAEEQFVKALQQSPDSQRIDFDDNDYQNDYIQNFFTMDYEFAFLLLKYQCVIGNFFHTSADGGQHRIVLSRLNLLARLTKLQHIEIYWLHPHEYAEFNLQQEVEDWCVDYIKRFLSPIYLLSDIADLTLEFIFY